MLVPGHFYKINYLVLKKVWTQLQLRSTWISKLKVNGGIKNNELRNLQNCCLCSFCLWVVKRNSLQIRENAFPFGIHFAQTQSTLKVWEVDNLLHVVLKWKIHTLYLTAWKPIQTSLYYVCLVFILRWMLPLKAQSNLWWLSVLSEQSKNRCVTWGNKQGGKQFSPLKFP